MEKRCNDCLYNYLSQEYEPDPDEGIIQKRICNECGKNYKFFIEHHTAPIHLQGGTK